MPTLHFPEDAGVGWVRAGEHETPVVNVPARGAVEIPEGLGVYLWLQVPVRGVERLGPSDVDMLHLPKQTPTDADFRRIAHLSGLRILYCSKSDRITDKGLASIAGMRRLRELNLYRAGVTDAGLAHLAGMTEMEDLHLGMTKVVGPGLVSLARMRRLQRLSLEDTPLDDSALPHLFALTGLRRLVVWGTRLSRSALHGLRVRMPGVEVASHDFRGRLVMGLRERAMPQYH